MSQPQTFEEWWQTNALAADPSYAKWEEGRAWCKVAWDAAIASQQAEVERKLSGRATYHRLLAALTELAEAKAEIERLRLYIESANQAFLEAHQARAVVEAAREFRRWLKSTPKTVQPGIEYAKRADALDAALANHADCGRLIARAALERKP